jgi:uncharacterized protein (TIGR02118 family)
VIIALSLIKRLPEVSIPQFRKHWLDPHGVLATGLPKLRRYTQSHVVDSPRTNALARKLDITGFAELWFDSYDDRQVAYTSPRMQECNVDSEQFIGAVARLVTEPNEAIAAPQGGAKAFIVNVGDRAAGESWAEAYQQRVMKLPGVRGYLRHKILEQAGAPGSRVAEFRLHVAALAEVSFENAQALANSAGELAGKGADAGDLALYIVEDHRLV